MVRRQEYFRIQRFRRIYNRLENKFSVNISYETAAPQPSDRVVAVAEGFGLGLDTWERFVIYDNVELKISPIDIVYITGDSGSGKSVLLRAIKQDLGEEAVDMGSCHVAQDKPLIETIGSTVEEAIELLSRVGLNDAFLFLRTYEQLSDGQKYRYRIAKMIESKKQWWIADEFCATLDRDTAKIVSFNVQKVARALGKAVIVATTHTDLLEDLSPNVRVHKRFGKEISIFPMEKTGTKSECSLVKEMLVEEGTRADWKALASFHYRSHNLGAVRKIFKLVRGDELCGVIVYCYPCPAAHGRRMVLPRMGMKEMNRQLSSIARVVIHPKYRTISLGAKLIRETLGLCGTPCVEMSAVMAKYNPFGEKAGMRKVVLQQPHVDVVRVAAVLEKLGFNLQLLGSHKYVMSKLEGLNPRQVGRLKKAFRNNAHPRYLKELRTDGSIFGTRAGKDKAFRRMELPKLAQLTKITGQLLQTKVYLFWSRPIARYRDSIS